MRAAMAVLSIGLLVFSAGGAADTTARWDEKPFFPRRPGEKVPPPAFFATTRAVPAGAEVRIKVVRCPRDATLEVHRFIGGPVFSTGGTKYADLSADKTLTHKLDRETTVGITTGVGGERGRCKSVERKDGYDVLTYSFGDLGDMVLEVEVVGK